ncbi:hypothetical protein [Cohnella thermotolerans]|uniref:hypothetical protein n=1 Tax=Cohnella thermotolerans TaxID=329858 RepID=UPI0004038130|nr:hypothetical protein [Cohnella thermotolerans]
MTRVGTFVVGGLAGIAMVMIMQRNKRMSAMAGSLGQNLMSRMGGMKEEAIGKMLNMRFTGRHSDKESSRRSENGEAVSGGLDQVAHLASKDSEVQRRVNEILEQNGHHQI